MFAYAVRQSDIMPPRNVLYWLNTRFRRKVGECKNPLIRSQHIFHVLRLKNRMPEKQRWQTGPPYKASPHNRLFPAFLTLKTGFSEMQPQS